MDPNSDFWWSIYVYSEFFCLNFLSLVLFGLQVIFFVGLVVVCELLSLDHNYILDSIGKPNVGSACNAMDCLSTMSPASRHLWTNRATITWKWMLLLLLSRLGHPSRPSRPYSYTTFKEQGLFNQTSKKYQTSFLPTSCSNLGPSPRTGAFLENMKTPRLSTFCQPVISGYGTMPRMKIWTMCWRAP